jgi:hypothetical protein
MTTPSYVRLQITVFTLVSAAFTNIYITPLLSKIGFLISQPISY